MLSIVIPVWNGERYIADALESIRAQNVAPLEIIVVDDGSTDGTRRIVERNYPECRYLFQDQAGPAAARNAALAIARGALIGFLDCDDLLADGALATLCARLAGNGRAEVAMGMVQAFQDESAAHGAPVAVPYAQPIVSYTLGSALVRRELFDRIGAFDSSYRHCEDVDWFMRAQEHGVVFDILDEVVLLYRRHPNNMSRDRVKGALDLTKVLKASLDRRRKLPGRETASVDEIYYVRPGRLRMN